MENKLKVSDTITIGIDISENDDISVMQIVRYSGANCEVINTLYGEEAEWTYLHLINESPFNWINANPAITKCFTPDFLNKPFHFPGENPLLKHFSLPQRPRRTSPDQMACIDEMYYCLEMKLHEKGGTINAHNQDAHCCDPSL